MFKAAQDNVWTMLENVCWPNFLTSPMFEGYIKGTELMRARRTKSNFCADKSKPRPTRSPTIDNLIKLQKSLHEKDSAEENQENKLDSAEQLIQ